MKIGERIVKNRNARPKDIDIDAIIIHKTGCGTVEGAIAWWNGANGNESSAHYIIGADGSVIRCVPEAERAWHAGVSEMDGDADVNDYSIGIEILSDGKVYNALQMAALVELTLEIMQRHPMITIPRIVGHEDICIPRIRKAGDPGSNFPWPDYRARVRAGLTRLGL